MRPPQNDEGPGERRNRPIVTNYSGDGDGEDKSNEGGLRQMLEAIGQDFCPRCKSLGSANMCVDRLVGAGFKKATGDHPERHQWYRAYGCLVAPTSGKPRTKLSADDRRPLWAWFDDDTRFDRNIEMARLVAVVERIVAKS